MVCDFVQQTVCLTFPALCVDYAGKGIKYLLMLMEN